MGQGFRVVDLSTSGFLLSGVLLASWCEAVTCTFEMKRAQCSHNGNGCHCVNPSRSVYVTCIMAREVL
jgi:hypothetical protein